MWTLDRPDDSLREELIRACSEPGSRGIRSDIKTRLLLSLDPLREIGHAFEHAAELGETWKLNDSQFRNCFVTRSELRDSYEQHLVRGTGRKVYDRILAMALLEMCAYCALGLASTLDHFLPKSDFPSLSLEPLNLVPTCKDCNHKKSSKLATSAVEEGVHPYFWATEENWLTCSVSLQDGDLSPFFAAAPCPHLSHETNLRIENMMTSLDLPLRYARASAGQIAELKTTVQMWPNNPFNGELFKEHVAERVESLRNTYGANHWKYALWLGISSADWNVYDWLVFHGERA